jgi:hypothetical protein
MTLKYEIIVRLKKVKPTERNGKNYLKKGKLYFCNNRIHLFLSEKLFSKVIYKCLT